MRRRYLRTIVVGAATLLLSCTRGPKLPPEARAALGNLTVAPGSPNGSLFRWQLSEGCRLEYSAHLADSDVRFSLTGGRPGYIGLAYPKTIAPPRQPADLLLVIGDNSSALMVGKVAEDLDEHGERKGKGIYQDEVFDAREAPSPWTGFGANPGLQVFFPSLPQSGIQKATRLEGWFNVAGHTAALVSARDDQQRFQGTYLVLESGRLLWARVVATDAAPRRTLEARLVSACDGPTLAP